MVSHSLRIQHFVDLPRLDSQIATARDHCNKIHIYFIVNHNGPVYKRNALAETWEELGPQDQLNLRVIAGHAGNVPHFNNCSSSNLN